MKLHYLISLLLLLTACNKDEETNVDLQSLLTASEIEDLSFLREEEKLAKDVYLYAYSKYGLQIFNNISRSEQTHMNRVLGLLNQYQIEDSASSEQGVFNNVELASIYVSLTNRVDQSLEEALKVGATIEDLDINDLNHFLENTTREDLITVYQNLNCGSQNHIRAFTNQLNSLGNSYEAQYISEEELQDILSQQSGGCGI